MEILIILGSCLLLFVNWLFINEILKTTNDYTKAINDLVDIVALMESQSKLEQISNKEHEKNITTNLPQTIEVLIPMTHEELELANKEQLNS